MRTERQPLFSLVIIMPITVNGLNQFLQLTPMVVLLLILLVSGFSQLVVGPTHLAGNRLDLVLTDVAETVKVTTMAPLGTSDHSAISIQLDWRKNIPAYTVTKVFLKGRINRSSVRQDVSRICLGSILSNPDPVSALNEELK